MVFITSLLRPPCSHDSIYDIRILTYLIWMLQMLLKKYGVYQGSQPVPENLLKPLVGMFYGNGFGGWLVHNTLLWFLVCLFVTELLFFYINKMSGNKSSAMLLILILFAFLGYADSIYSPIRLPFSIDVAFVAIVFYGLGYVLRNGLPASWLGLFFAIVCLAVGILTSHLNGRIDMNENHYGNGFLFYLSALSNIYFYIYLFAHVANSKYLERIAFVGKNSMKSPRNLKTRHSAFFPDCIEYDDVGLLQKLRTVPKMFYSLDSKERFSQLLSEQEPDIVHGHNIYGRLTSSIVDVAKKASVPMVLTLHDYKLICPAYLMLNHGATCEKCKNYRYYSCTITRCHRNSFLASLVYTAESYFSSILKKYNWIRYLICPSEFMRNKCVEMGLPEAKLRVIHNFLDYTGFEPNYEGGNYALYAGKLTKEKGVMTLIKAVKGLDFPLKIVGDGEMRRRIEAFVKENDIKNVEFLGFKSGEELKSYFRNAAFHIVPSEWYENAPMDNHRGICLRQTCSR